MKVLIIYAHPNPESFNAALLKAVERGLREAGHAYAVIDLYKDRFNPVLVYNDKIRRRDLKNDPETAHYRELVRDADHLIFIFPVWWYGVPAILKGFFDRVFASGFAYRYDGAVPKGLLKGKSAWVVYTLDSPGWYVRLVRRSVEWTVIRDAILKFCGIRKVRRFMFAGVKRSSIKRRQKWLAYLYHQARFGLR
ncbi:NAD(P)H-dependent oxidoreductase [Caenibacillus caldisaponilyticus]|uniref:NAD(P)H-dependent oxidoreductase n=1 Tax=Caenibacillus caldisaponilyticus TaxID=1674942 RepID=UPI0009886722|nr:NAD(P)H-dependent oxidoreductase [Caenibacillus caldisaponilyticus]